MLGLGDLDHDGYDDYAVAATGADGGRGRIYIVMGSSSAMDLSLSVPTVSTDTTLVGATAGENAGWSLAAADYDGDSYVDLAIGAPHRLNGSLEMTGVVYLVHGERLLDSGSFDLVDADCVIWGEDARDQFGFALAAGEVHGDGYPDLAIGAPGHDGRRGRIHLLAGGPDLWTSCPTTADAFATIDEIAVAGLGHSLALAELDGHMGADLVAGAPVRSSAGKSYRGHVYVWRDTTLTSGSPYLPARIWRGDEGGDRAGWSVAAASMGVDADPSVLVGAPGADVVDSTSTHTDAGKAYVVDVTSPSGPLGSRADRIVFGDADDDALGTSVASGGDLDLEPGDEVLVGIPGHDGATGTDSGGVFVLQDANLADYEAPGLAASALTAPYYGSAAGGRLGTSVGRVGDINDDGLDEAIAGEPDAVGTGRVHLGPPAP